MWVTSLSCCGTLAVVEKKDWMIQLYLAFSPVQSRQGKNKIKVSQSPP